MKNHLSYKNYYGSINCDQENNLLYGKIEFVKALITYEAEDVSSLKKAFQDAVDDYIAFCEKKGIAPEQPFKGSLNVRIGEKRHRLISRLAYESGMTINERICQALDESFKRNDDMKIRSDVSSVSKKREKSRSKDANHE
jgi:predicted HicB family RNase H-like nuclease